MKKLTIKDKELKSEELLELLKNNYDEIRFKRCNFSEDIDLILTGVDIKNLFFSMCTFNRYFIFRSDVFRNVSFVKCIFNKTVDFISINTINQLTISYCLFKDYTSFKDLIISNINISASQFFEVVLFFNIEINLINLKSTTFNKKLEFHNVESSTLKTKKNIFANRETARIIKDSFEQQNNIIEANKYYALEMKEREKELNKDRKEGKNLLEWLVFKVHGLASNHSQDWLLSLFWILSFSFGYGFINCINEYLDTKLEFMLIDIFLFGVITLISVFVVESKRINNYMLIAIFYLIYGFASKDFNLFDISNNINPFSIMTGWQELSFITLSYKIIIAYLIYQLIISIRQNTRRK